MCREACAYCCSVFAGRRQRRERSFTEFLLITFHPFRHTMFRRRPRTKMYGRHTLRPRNISICNLRSRRTSLMHTGWKDTRPRTILTLLLGTIDTKARPLQRTLALAHLLCRNALRRDDIPISILRRNESQARRIMHTRQRNTYRRLFSNLLPLPHHSHWFSLPSDRDLEDLCRRNALRTICVPIRFVHGGRTRVVFTGRHRNTPRTIQPLLFVSERILWTTMQLATALLF